MDNLAAIIARIQRMLALAKSSPSEAEASNAASQAAELMTRYRIEQAEIEGAGGDAEVDPIVEEVAEQLGLSGRRVRWKHHLADSIAKLNGCQLWMYRERDVLDGKLKCRFKIFGRRGDVQATTYTVRYLWSEVEHLAEQAAKAAGKGTSERRWRNSFKMGVCERLWQRVQAEISTKRAAVKAGAEAGTTALVIVAKHQQEVDEAYEAVRKERKIRSANTGRARMNHNAYYQGTRAITGGAKGALGPMQGRLGAK